MSLIYKLPHSSELLELTPKTLAHFDRYRQKRFYAKEAGGQLFAIHVKPNFTKIISVTGPRRSDKRSRHRYQPNRRVEQHEIDTKFDQGLHYIGDWHTHPQSIPIPSHTDIESINETEIESSHSLGGLIMIIVGLAEFPSGISVTYHTHSTYYTLNLV